MKLQKMSYSTKTDWFIIWGVIGLAFVPLAAGIFRLIQLATGAVITPENTRFFLSPQPVVVHIFFSVIYTILGASQFAPNFRFRNTAPSV